MRISFDAFLGVVYASLAQQLYCTGAGFFVAQCTVALDRLDQLLLHRHQRVETCLRVLEYHGNAIAPQSVCLLVAQAAQVSVGQVQGATADITR